MDVGMMMLFSSSGWENGSDARMWEEDLRLAEIAADLGFDCVWSTEHHFNDYSFVPDNLQLMSYVTAKHPHIDVGTAAVILPWHNPLRVAENAAVLDLLSNGRLRLGFGRLCGFDYGNFRQRRQIGDDLVSGRQLQGFGFGRRLQQACDEKADHAERNQRHRDVSAIPLRVALHGWKADSDSSSTPVPADDPCAKT